MIPTRLCTRNAPPVIYVNGIFAIIDRIDHINDASIKTILLFIFKIILHSVLELHVSAKMNRFLLKNDESSINKKISFVHSSMMISALK